MQDQDISTNEWFHAVIAQSAQPYPPDATFLQMLHRFEKTPILRNQLKAFNQPACVIEAGGQIWQKRKQLAIEHYLPSTHGAGTASFTNNVINFMTNGRYQQLWDQALTEHVATHNVQIDRLKQLRALVEREKTMRTFGLGSDQCPTRETLHGFKDALLRRAYMSEADEAEIVRAMLYHEDIKPVFKTSLKVSVEVQAENARKILKIALETITTVDLPGIRAERSFSLLKRLNRSDQMYLLLSQWHEVTSGKKVMVLELQPSQNNTREWDTRDASDVKKHTVCPSVAPRFFAYYRNLLLGDMNMLALMTRQEPYADNRSAENDDDNLDVNLEDSRPPQNFTQSAVGNLHQTEIQQTTHSDATVERLLQTSNIASALDSQPMVSQSQQPYSMFGTFAQQTQQTQLQATNQMLPLSQFSVPQQIASQNERPDQHEEQKGPNQLPSDLVNPSNQQIGMHDINMQQPDYVEPDMVNDVQSQSSVLSPSSAFSSPGVRKKRNRNRFNEDNGITNEDLGSLSLSPTKRLRDGCKKQL